MLNAAEEAFQHLLFQVALDTGTRPIEVGPESTETGAHVYRRLAGSGAVAEIYWVEGRGWWEDLRGSCPIRTDLPCELRCAALAEAAVLLMRRPHWCTRDGRTICSCRRCSTRELPRSLPLRRWWCGVNTAWRVRR